jgi:tetratricopeptide (TPR) repeat protein
MILPNILVAQNANKIDQYYDSLSNAKHDTDYVHVYSMLCFHYSVSNLDSAIFFGKKGLQLAEKIKNERSIANVKNSLGWAYYKKHDYRQAERLMNEARQVWQKRKDRKSEMMVMNNLASVYMDEQNYAKSLEYMKEILNLDDSLNNLFTKGNDLHTIGRLYNLMKDFKAARQFFEQALNIFEKLKEPEESAKELMSIGNTYVSEKKYKESIPYYNRSIAIFEKTDMHNNTGLVYENTALAYFGLNNHIKAFSYIENAINLYKKMDSKIDLYYALFSKGEMLEKIKDDKDAIICFTKAKSLSEELKDATLQYPVMEKLSTAYSRMGDFFNAYQLLKASIHIKDSIANDNNQHELLKLKTEFDTERKEKENSVLKAQNESARLKLQRNSIMLVGSLAMVLTLSILTFLFYKNKETKARHIVELNLLNKELEKKKNSIAHFNNILELKAIRARMNPHFIFNCMSSIQECLLTGQTSIANHYLTKLSRLLRMVLMYTDDESITLDKELDMLLLYLQLENLRLNENFFFDIECDENIDPADVKIPTLLLQPFAENAIWHGLIHKKGERKVVVRVSSNANILYCFIEDNGIGFEKTKEINSNAKKHQSMGLKMTQRRLDILNEQSNSSIAGVKIIDLLDEKNTVSGTRVEITLPLEYV